MSTADDGTAWADKIDERLGPISGADADRLARFLRRVSSEIAVMERQMVLAQTIEIQRVKALLRDLLEVSFPAIGADPDTEMYLRQKYDEVTGRAKNLLGIKDDKS